MVVSGRTCARACRCLPPDWRFRHVRDPWVVAYDRLIMILRRHVDKPKYVENDRKLTNGTDGHPGFMTP